MKKNVVKVSLDKFVFSFSCTSSVRPVRILSECLNILGCQRESFSWISKDLVGV